MAPKVYLFSPWRLRFARPAAPATRETSDSPTFLGCQAVLPICGFLKRTSCGTIELPAFCSGFAYCRDISENALFNQRRSRQTKRAFSVNRVAPGALLLMRPFNVLYGWCPFQTRECKTCKRQGSAEELRNMLNRSSFFFFMSVETEMQLDTAELWKVSDKQR